MRLEIEPLIGVGLVRFNATRTEIRSILGEPEWERDGRECFLSGLMINFDDLGLVEFIEMASSEKFSATFHGKELHNLTVEDAIAWVSVHGSAELDASEAPYSFLFPDLQISLWRGVMPESESDPDGMHFEAVGLGRKGYFDAPT